MSNSERMAPSDTTWLRMDRPTNFMIIVGVLILRGPVDALRLEKTLSKRLLAIPRFRQRAEMRLTGAWWCDDPGFDITRHIKRIRLPGVGGKPELQHFVGELASTPLDLNRPLWQFHIVEDYEGGAVIVARIHHAIADGIALVGILLSLTDEPMHTAGYGKPPPQGGAWPGVFRPVADVIGQGLRFSGEILRGSLAATTNPTQALRDGTGIAAELAHLLLLPDDSRTRLKGALSGNKRIAWTDPMPLPEFKAVSQVLGCSVNDMTLAAVAGALNGYLKDHGDETEGVEIRVLVPVNLRTVGAEQELGNQFGLIALELPVGLENPLARLYEVHRRIEALKHSYEAPVTLGLIAILGFAPKVVQDTVLELLLSRVTAVMTNVPGPQKPLHLAGSEISQVMFWVPQTANIGVGGSLLSFNGQVQFGLMTDAALVPDPEAIVSRFKFEFEQLLYFVLLQPCDWLPQRNRPRRKAP